MDTGAWLTAARTARLPLVLRAIRSHPPPGIPRDRAERIIWRLCGGPLDEVTHLIDVLVRAGLISRGNVLRLTRDGRHVGTQDHQHGGTLIARKLIRAGFYSDQVLQITQRSSIDNVSGDLNCGRRVAIEAAPQLVGLLRRFEGVEWGSNFRVPGALMSELLDVWTMLPERISQNEDLRKPIGDRGEMYSYQFERLRSSDSSKIQWVSRDDEGLGYDIEDLSSTPSRRIEAKASGSGETRFYLSANEWDVAHRHAENYEIHFWGNIDLSRTPQDEYVRLRASGYPIIYQNLPERLLDGSLVSQPIQYLIEGRLSC